MLQDSAPELAASAFGSSCLITVALMFSSALGRDEVRQRVTTAANLIAAAHLLVPSEPGAFSAPLEIWCVPPRCYHNVW